MIGYPYIESLFKAILSKSKVTKGNFYLCPKWGSELNNPNIDEQIPIGAAATQKYPAVLLMPPPITGNFEYSGDPDNSGNSLYDIYEIRLLFVTPAQVTGKNQVTTPNGVNLSAHTIMETWHDMSRIAHNFCAVLKSKVLSSSGGNALFWDGTTPRMLPVTNLGNDQVSGVMVMFKFGLFSGCAIEDYPNDWQTSIVLPNMTDTHPIHSM